MDTFADRAVRYFLQLKSPRNVPEGFKVVNPYNNSEVKKVMREFYEKFYNDSNERLFVFGINPGRFGGGLTGISFTDPVTLREFCGIENNLGIRRELSSKFVYMVIERYGGVNKFFSKIFLTALYPLMILKPHPSQLKSCGDKLNPSLPRRGGNNCNYYDDKELYKALKQSITSSVEEQIKIGARSDVAVCLGRKNGEYLEEMNKEFKFFKRIIILNHPRWIMQYKLKSAEKYIEEYLKVLKM